MSSRAGAKSSGHGGGCNAAHPGPHLCEEPVLSLYRQYIPAGAKKTSDEVAALRLPTLGGMEEEALHC